MTVTDVSARGACGLVSALTLEMYTWQIMCSPAWMSLVDLVMKMPLPWQPVSGLQMYVLFFLARMYAWKSLKLRTETVRSEGATLIS